MTNTQRSSSASRHRRRLAVAALAAGWTFVVLPGASAQHHYPVVLTEDAAAAAGQADVVPNKAALEYAERQAGAPDQLQPASPAEALTATPGLDLMSGAGGLALGALLGAGATAVIMAPRRTAVTPRTT